MTTTLPPSGASAPRPAPQPRSRQCMILSAPRPTRSTNTRSARGTTRPRATRELGPCKAAKGRAARLRTRGGSRSTRVPTSSSVRSASKRTPTRTTIPRRISSTACAPPRTQGMPGFKLPKSSCSTARRAPPRATLRFVRALPRTAVRSRPSTIAVRCAASARAAPARRLKRAAVAASRMFAATRARGTARNDLTEDVTKAYDNLMTIPSSSKWCVRSAPSTSTPVSTVYDFAGSTAFAINKYTLTAGNDEPTRDPRDWTLQGCQGSCTAGSDSGWITLDTRTNQFASAGRIQTIPYTFTNTTAYQQYRLRVTANYGADIFQVSEIQLFAVPGASCTPETNAAFCTRLSAACGSVTALDNCGTSRTVSSCGTCTSPQTCGGGGVPNACGTAAGSTPCSGLCTNPTIFTTQSYQSPALGTGATCHQTTANLQGVQCSEVTAPRTFSVNGTVRSCSTNTPPAKRNGGYCIQTTAGNPSWASFVTW